MDHWPILRILTAAQDWGIQILFGLFVARRLHSDACVILGVPETWLVTWLAALAERLKRVRRPMLESPHAEAIRRSRRRR